MSFNWLFFPVIMLAIIFFYAGSAITKKFADRTRNGLVVIGLLLLSVVFSIPGLLFTLYYLHLFDNSIWFYEFRAVPLTELLASGLGFLGGVISALPIKKRLFPSGSNLIPLMLLILWLSMPYIKPIIFAEDLNSFKDKWKDGVTIQSASSCGPASTATLLKKLGHSVTEKEIAEEVYTSSRGTENWYLARAIRSRGFKVSYIQKKPNPDNLPYPSIAGVTLQNGIGHFIAILGEIDGRWIVGDSLEGKLKLDKNSIGDKYHFTGFFMVVSK